MSADLAAKIAKFQEDANASIEEMKANKDERYDTLEAERKTRQATLTQLVDELKAKIAHAKDELIKCNHEQKQSIHHGYGKKQLIYLAQVEDKDLHHHEKHVPDFTACKAVEARIEAIKASFQDALDASRTGWSARVSGARADNLSEKEQID